MDVSPLVEATKSLLVSAETPKTPETIASLQALLTQAIHSGDVQLIEKALEVTNKKLIHATLRKLPPTHIPQLLDHFVVRLQKRPQYAGLLVEWIRGCLQYHSSYLLSVSSVLNIGSTINTETR